GESRRVSTLNACALHVDLTVPAELQVAHPHGAGTRAIRMQGADFRVSNRNASPSSNGASRADCMTLSTLDRKVLADVASQVVVRTYAAGTAIIRQGDAADP